MGLPEGHVTDVPGLSRTAQLKALGNGVVPAQAQAALRALLARGAERNYRGPSSASRISKQSSSASPPTTSRSHQSSRASRIAV